MRGWGVASAFSSSEGELRGGGTEIEDGGVPATVVTERIEVSKNEQEERGAAGRPRLERGVEGKGGATLGLGEEGDGVTKWGLDLLPAMITDEELLMRET